MTLVMPKNTTESANTEHSFYHSAHTASTYPHSK